MSKRKHSQSDINTIICNLPYERAIEVIYINGYAKSKAEARKLKEQAQKKCQKLREKAMSKMDEATAKIMDHLWS